MDISEYNQICSTYHDRWSAHRHTHQYVGKIKRRAGKRDRKHRQKLARHRRPTSSSSRATSLFIIILNFWVIIIISIFMWKELEKPSLPSYIVHKIVHVHVVAIQHDSRVSLSVPKEGYIIRRILYNK